VNAGFRMQLAIMRNLIIRIRLFSSCCGNAVPKEEHDRGGLEDSPEGRGGDG
jgi:hypothetical protein